MDEQTITVRLWKMIHRRDAELGKLRERLNALEVALADFAKFARTSHNGHPGPLSCYGCALLVKHAVLLAEGESPEGN